MKYFKNTSWLFGEKILRMVVGLFVGIWVARYLGPGQFGLFSYAQSFVGLFAAFATLGLDSIVIRELVKDESRRESLLGTTFRLKLIGALLVLFVLAVAVKLSHQDSLTTLLIFIVASATIFQSFNVIDFYFQSKVLSKYIVYANIVSLLISNLVKIALILNEAPLLYFAYVVLFDSFILVCGFLVVYRYKKFFVNQWQFDVKVAVSLLKDSWPLMLSGLAISVYVKIDQVMIKEMLDVEAVGQYAAAVRLSEAWYFIPVVLASSLFPAIINAKKQSEALYSARVEKLYDLMVWISLAIAVPMTFLSDWVVGLLYGEQYSQAGGVLMIHIWASISVFLGVASSKWLVTENLQRYSTINTVVGMVMNVGLNYFLIKYYGINGSAIATVISYTFSGYILLIVFKKTRGNFFSLSKSLFFYRFIKVRGLWNIK